MTSIATITTAEQAGVWLRVSTKMQDEAAQEPDLLAWCADHGYDIRERYTVHGKSAYHGKQDEYLNRAIADMAAGKIAVLVVWASDRIERRGAYNAFDLARRVREAGGRIEYVKDAYLNDANDMSDVMLALAATRDHQESKRKSERIKAQQESLRAGKHLVGRAPFGYTVAGDKYAKRLVPAEELRDFARGIFESVAAGTSLADVALWLDAAGVRPAGGGQWHAGRVAAVIRNPTYKGQRREQDPATKRYGKLLHECPEVVDGDLWRRANDNLNSRPGRGRRMADQDHAPSLLSGVLRCPACGGPMYRLFSNGQPMYRCAGKGAVRRSECKNLVSCAAVDACVESVIAEWDRQVMRAVRIPGHDYSAELEQVRDALRDLADAGLSEDDEDARRAELRAERRRLEALPAVPARTELQPTGETYAQQWDRLDGPQRTAWLRERGVVAYAAKTDREWCETMWDQMDGAILRSGYGASVVVTTQRDLGE